jgi:hypothetical protein
MSAAFVVTAVVPAVDTAVGTAPLNPAAAEAAASDVEFYRMECHPFDAPYEEQAAYFERFFTYIACDDTVVEFENSAAGTRLEFRLLTVADFLRESGCACATQFRQRWLAHPTRRTYPSLEASPLVNAALRPYRDVRVLTPSQDETPEQESVRVGFHVHQARTLTWRFAADHVFPRFRASDPLHKTMRRLCALTELRNHLDTLCCQRTICPGACAAAYGLEECAVHTIFYGGFEGQAPPYNPYHSKVHPRPNVLTTLGARLLRVLVRKWQRVQQEVVAYARLAAFNPSLADRLRREASSTLAREIEVLRRAAAVVLPEDGEHA